MRLARGHTNGREKGVLMVSLESMETGAGGGGCYKWDSFCDHPLYNPQLSAYEPTGLGSNPSTNTKSILNLEPRIPPLV